MSGPILALAVASDQDVMSARRTARQVAAILGFDAQDQVRIATAVSEIARNAQRYAGGGRVEFVLEGKSAPQVLLVEVSDRGPGIPDLQAVLARDASSAAVGGIVGAHRLMDQCEIRSTSAGTKVVLKKLLPPRAPIYNATGIEQLAKSLAARTPVTPFEEVQQQNRELIRTLAELRERQEDLTRLNHELEDTNRGVVALYAELDEKADHLRRADEMKSRFLSNMSHEFRTPLNSIRALAQLLVSRTDGELTAEQEKQVSYIQKSAADLTALVDDLLDLAKIEAGKIDVRPVEFSVDNLFSALRGMLRPLLLTERVALRFDEPVGLPPIYADEAKVSQILRNFISNALKFTERGEVRVHAELDPAAQTVTFGVTDTGIGIAPADQDRIFDEFTQIHGPLQARVKGTGLGLPLCRKLAALMGGVVKVTSEPGLGSTFTVTIPLRYDLAPETESPAAEMPAADESKIPVLVVEDEDAAQMFYEKILRGTGYRVIAARSLREAEDGLARRPAIVVLDILLRGETSWAWLNRLKSDPATCHIPVVMATNVDDRRHAEALGADAYLQKPVDKDRLVEALDGFTRRHVLVIDDDQATRYAIRKVLDSSNYYVFEAATGGDGLRVAETMRPKLIVLDLGLPDMTGERVLDELKDNSITGGIPVIIATARDLADPERSRLQRKARQILSKSNLNVDLPIAVAGALDS